MTDEPKYRNDWQRPDDGCIEMDFLGKDRSWNREYMQQPVLVTPPDENVPKLLNRSEVIAELMNRGYSRQEAKVMTFGMAGVMNPRQLLSERLAYYERVRPQQGPFVGVGRTIDPPGEAVRSQDV